MKMTKTMWWMVGGVSVTGLAFGGYLWYKNRQEQKNEMPMITNSSKGKSTIVNTGGKKPPITEPNWKAPFDMNYLNDVKKWLQGKSIKELSIVQAKKYAEILKNAKGLIDDDEDAVQKVFRSLQDKTQVASISWAFYHNHKKDLWQYLRSFLSDREMKTLVTDPVKKLPNYRLA